MTEPNAIERLRETVKFLFTYHDKEPYQKVMADLAAVDALYQAAKTVSVVLSHASFGGDLVVKAGEVDALAAAVSLVEGTASPQETARRVDGDD